MNSSNGDSYNGETYFGALGIPTEEDPDGQGDGGIEAFVSELNRRVSDYYNFYGSSGLFERDKRAYLELYGISADGDAVSFKPVQGGENGQLVKIQVNHFGNLIAHRKSLVTAKRPALDARATNSDADSLEQTTLANDALEHFVRVLGMEAVSRDMVGMADAMRESWLWTKWNSNAGSTYAAAGQPGQSQKTGAPEVVTLMGQDVIRDVTAPGTALRQWLIVREFVNRFDLASKFPDRKDEIMAIPTADAQEWRVEFQPWQRNTDFVPIYRFYHEKTDSLPQGRQATFFKDSSVPLIDGPLRYGGKLPVLQLSPARIMGTPFGHTPMHDILGLQAVYNALISGVITNELTFTVRRLLKPRGQPLSAKALTQDLGVLEYDAKLPMPTMLETNLTTNERLEAIGKIEELMQTLSGINDVIRGNGGDAGTKAASGLALIQNQALQFLSGLEFEYADFFRRWGELMLAILRERAGAPLMIAIVGKDKQSVLRSFKGEDLANEYRVTVDLGDSLARTAAGREQRATLLLDGGFLGVGPEALPRYLEVCKTGTLDPIVTEVTSEDDLIKRENEAILRGEVPPVSEFDSPAKHYAGHSITAFSQEMRIELQNESKSGVDPMGQPLVPSKKASALRQHMLLHRMAEQKAASIQNAQAATLIGQQAIQAPQPPQGPGGPPQGGGNPPPADSQPNPSGTPGIRAPGVAHPPASAQPLPGQ